MTASYYVEARWDGEAGVWVSESDIPGLVIEAESLAEFEQLMMQLAPEVLAENADVRGRSVPLLFRVADQRELMLA